MLGLTFTNKAAGELAERVRKALVRAGVTDPDVIDPDNPPGEPVISTYYAFAGRLLTDHGLRIGLEPTSRLLADAHPLPTPPACCGKPRPLEVWTDEPAEDEENPALHQAAADQAWPLPLDDTALARRRAAAETVLAHLDALAAAEHGRPAATHDPDAHDDPEWPPARRKDDLPYDEAPYEDDPYADEHSPGADIPGAGSPGRRRPRPADRPGRKTGDSMDPPPARPFAAWPDPFPTRPSTQATPVRPRRTPRLTPRRPASSPPGTGISTPSPASCCARGRASRRSPCPPRP
ncbi:hypothetical protein SALBM311S_09155 [Streptomyces alboniger]